MKAIGLNQFALAASSVLLVAVVLVSEIILRLSMLLVVVFRVQSNLEIISSSPMSSGDLGVDVDKHMKFSLLPLSLLLLLLL